MFGIPCLNSGAVAEDFGFRRSPSEEQELSPSGVSNKQEFLISGSLKPGSGFWGSMLGFCCQKQHYHHHPRHAEVRAHSDLCLTRQPFSSKLWNPKTLNPYITQTTGRAPGCCRGRFHSRRRGRAPPFVQLKVLQGFLQGFSEGWASIWEFPKIGDPKIVP